MQAFIYLAHRDKKGIQLMGIMESKLLYHQKINVKDLQLTQDLEKILSETVRENKMKWDLWIQSANNYQELVKKLTDKGFSNFPRTPMTKFEFTIQSIMSKLKQD
jgi:hypothetical protein